MSHSAGVFVALLAAPTLLAQSLEIYSEFQRVDPFGKIVPIDRAERPREILSPAIPRNGHASFHVVVSVPPGANYFLFVASNPADACRATLYKEHFVKTNAGWVPDRLVEVNRIPDFGAMPDPDQAIPGQDTRVYLLDVWAPPDAEPGRFRLEAQLRIGYWIIRPMEVRIVPARIPAAPETASARMPALPGIDQGADAVAAAAMDLYIAGKLSPAGVRPSTVRDVIWRNAVQDMALAKSLDPGRAGPEALRKFWLDLPPRKSLGAERYLRVRDYLYSSPVPVPSR